MEIVYTSKAVRDIELIEEYYAPRSTKALSNIIAEIISVVEDIPNSLSKGRQTDHPDVWEKITPKYKYLLPYYVFQGKLFILRVYQPRRGALDYDEAMDFDE